MLDLCKLIFGTMIDLLRSRVTLEAASGAVLWALRSNHPHNPAPDELYSTDHHNVADGLTTLPQDYAGIPRDVPRLGPPLPGDLGRPIVTAKANQDQLALMPNNNVPTRKPRRRELAKYLRPQPQR